MSASDSNSSGSSDVEIDSESIRNLYTTAMLAELIDVPVTAIRRWQRSGVLRPTQSVRRLSYFDFAEVTVARHLASLYNAGCSLKVIDRKLAQLKKALPEVERPLSDPAIVVTGRCLYLRRGEDLSEPSGQMLIDFDKPEEELEANLFTDSPMVLSISGESHDEQAAVVEQSQSLLNELQQAAIDWEDQGELERAAETYRALLVAQGPTAEVNFALADLLYRAGELSAARERYYVAIEIDEEYVEARANLGCVLAEQGELELASAAFEGALAYHPDYADVHYHLACVLDRLKHPEKAQLHWQTFYSLAPESPWAGMARERLGIAESDVQAMADS